MVTEFDLTLDGGGTLHAYDAGSTGGAEELAVLWHHGTPNLGAPPLPLFPTADELGIRFVSYDRPGYGGSTAEPERTIASAAAYAAHLADALAIDRFAVMGHSGGSSHALACAGLLSERVLGVVSVAALAPYGADGLDWYAGMAPSGVASLRAAAAGRAAKEAREASGADYDPEFTTADLAALDGDWSWLGRVVGPAMAAGPGGLIADDLAYVAGWGVDPGQVEAPTLLLHGGKDRVVPSSHGEWLARHCPSAELRVFPEDGHISVLTSAADGLRWLKARTTRR
ncbi:MAG: alpha/beta fold hydrolase [Mycobacteriales bacterium]